MAFLSIKINTKIIIDIKINTNINISILCVYLAGILICKITMPNNSYTLTEKKTRKENDRTQKLTSKHCFTAHQGGIKCMNRRTRFIDSEGSH